MSSDFVYANRYSQYMNSFGSGMVLVDLETIPESIRKKYSKRELAYLQKTYGRLSPTILSIVVTGNYGLKQQINKIVSLYPSITDNDLQIFAEAILNRKFVVLGDDTLRELASNVVEYIKNAETKSQCYNMIYFKTKE